MAKLQNELICARRELSKDFGFFRKQYFPHLHDAPDCVFHKEMVETLSGIAKSRPNKLAIAAPRGSAKSTLISCEYVLYLVCHGIEPFIVLISSTAIQAERLLANVKRELEMNERLAEDFPDVSEMRKKKPGPPHWRQDGINTRNGVEVAVLTPNKQIRGIRSGKHRPTLVILDDVEADTENQTPESFYKLEEWFSRSVLNAGDGHTNYILLGTIHSPHSFLGRYTDPEQHPIWTKKVYRSVISWSGSTRWQAWTNILTHRTEFKCDTGLLAAKKYFEEHRVEMLEGTQVLWPERMDYYALMLKREENQHSFDAEYQNQPIDWKSATFQIDTVTFWSDRFASQHDLLPSLGPDIEYFGACDPSMGKHHHKGDYSAIIIGARDRKGIVYILLADIKRRSPDETIDAVLHYCQQVPYIQFGFEKNGFQDYMRSILEKKGAERKIYPQIVPITNTSDKKGRIESLQPHVKNGFIQFSRKQVMLLEQMKYYPKGHDDGLDALEILMQVIRETADNGPKIHIIRTGNRWGGNRFA